MIFANDLGNNLCNVKMDPDNETVLVVTKKIFLDFLQSHNPFLIKPTTKAFNS